MIINSNISETARLYKDVQVTKSTVSKMASIGDESIIVNSEIGDFCEIDRRNYIHNSSIGCMTYTGWNSYIGMCDIGKFCAISRNFDAGGGEHNYLSASMLTHDKFYQLITSARPEPNTSVRIKVGNDVWIGQGVTILKKNGISIGDGAVLGSGAVVTKDIPPYAIAVGVPARVIKYRFRPEVIEELLNIKWWDWPMEIIKKYWEVLNEELTSEVLNRLTEISKHIC